MRSVVSGPAIGLVVTAVLAGCSDIGSSTPSESAPEASAAWVTFTSDRYGYSIDHPADWQVRETPGSVLPVNQRIGSPGLDVIASKEAFRLVIPDGRVTVSAHALEPGETLAAFTDRFSTSAACRAPGVSNDFGELGGEKAEIRSFTCGNFAWLQVTALHAGRGYVVWLVATEPPDPEQRPVNDRLLSTFRFGD